MSVLNWLSEHGLSLLACGSERLVEVLEPPTDELGQALACVLAAGFKDVFPAEGLLKVSPRRRKPAMPRLSPTLREPVVMLEA